MDTIRIIGLGSAGQRHAVNARKLGCHVVGYDVRPATPELRAESFVEFCDSPGELVNRKPLAIIVATPPDAHSEAVGYAMAAGIPTLIEKPMFCFSSVALACTEEYAKIKVPLAVGYQLRHVASLKQLKTQVDAGKFGTIYAAHAEFASQGWCSGTYKADLLLECSHELDLLRWFLGAPDRIVALGFTGGASWDAMLLCGPQGIRTMLHIDSVLPSYRRRLTLYGTKGQGEWVFNQTENDQAYVDELKDFLAVCRGEKAQPECTGDDGVWALRMVEAIRRSGESGKWEAC